MCTYTYLCACVCACVCLRAHARAHACTVCVRLRLYLFRLMIYYSAPHVCVRYLPSKSSQGRYNAPERLGRSTFTRNSHSHTHTRIHTLAYAHVHMHTCNTVRLRSLHTYCAHATLVVRGVLDVGCASVSGVVSPQLFLTRCLPLLGFF